MQFGVKGMGRFLELAEKAERKLGETPLGQLRQHRDEVRHFPDQPDGQTQQGATIYHPAVRVTPAAALCTGDGPRAAMSAQSATPTRDGSQC